MSDGLGDSSCSPDASLAEVDFGFTSTITGEGFGSGPVVLLSPLKLILLAPRFLFYFFRYHSPALPDRRGSFPASAQALQPDQPSLKARIERFLARFFSIKFFCQICKLLLCLGERLLTPCRHLPQARQHVLSHLSIPPDRP